MIAREHHCISSLVRALVIETHPYEVSYACRGHFVKSIIIIIIIIIILGKKEEEGDVTHKHNLVGYRCFG